MIQINDQDSTEAPKRVYHGHGEAFRQRIATVDERGQRRWIFPTLPWGQYAKARTVVAIFLIALFFSGPWITINGHPLLLMNLLGRRFSVLGQPFWPQDFILLALGFLAATIFLLLFTVVWGRLFCGWVCPQTVFLEHVFRRIEVWIEGPPAKRRRLRTQAWNWDKLWRRTAKWSLYFLVAFAVANTFMMYFVGSDGWLATVSNPPSENMSAFLGVLGFTGLFYFIFAWFREQACTLVCPYARLQGVLLDKDSVQVTYDFVRGEPRMPMNKARKHADPGDCVDCRDCLKVCPTGIDIRNGSQLECVNCTACMDACDARMDKVGRPRGLIRYASHNGVETRRKWRFTPRIIGYIAILTVLLGVLIGLLVTRSDVEAIILRTPGQLFQEVEETGYIQNLYNVKLVNKTHHEYPIQLRLIEPAEGNLQLVGRQLTLPANDMAEQAFFIQLPRDVLDPLKTEVRVEVLSGDELLETVSTTFMGPAQP